MKYFVLDFLTGLITGLMYMYAFTVIAAGISIFVNIYKFEWFIMIPLVVLAIIVIAAGMLAITFFGSMLNKE